MLKVSVPSLLLPVAPLVPPLNAVQSSAPSLHLVLGSKHNICIPIMGHGAVLLSHTAFNAALYSSRGGATAAPAAPSPLCGCRGLAAAVVPACERSMLTHALQEFTYGPTY